MARIKQLTPLEAQKIAAGEVVERPANVVKELLENALDAGASTITLYIKDGGKELIRVVDNGCGMSPEDAHLCFAHHATSKITTVNDLPTLSTFGFRGEALSSIASVSHVTLLTKESHADHATQLTLEGAQLIDECAQAACDGTDITIEQLFYNVPARKKFLKTRETEWRAIVHLFQALALAHTAVHFKLYSEGQMVYNCPPTQQLATRALQLWDHAFSAQLLELTPAGQSGDVIISGLISNQHYFKYDRSGIFLFANKRWVKNHHISKAVLQGYANVTPPGRFPAALLFIECQEPGSIDINIHPRKEEVQFLHPRRIESQLTQQVKKTLELQVNEQLQTPARTLHNASPSQFAFDPKYDDHVLPTHNPWDPQHTIAATSTQLQELFSAPAQPVGAPSSVSVQTSLSTAITQDHLFADYQIIGQFRKTYILLEKEDGLLLVDQHAAHERVLYELFSKRFKELPTINLLFPTMITVGKDDIALIESHLQLFKDNGIDLEIFGIDQIIVNATPVHLKDVALDELIRQAIGFMYEYLTFDREFLHKQVNERLHAQMACKGAVKAGDIMDQQAIKQLLDDLQQVDNRFTCPHGRPTCWQISLYEIERKFKRKV